MITITDCGCSEHQSSQFNFGEDMASMIKCLITNLHKCGQCYSYICEYGHTHSVIPHLSDPKIVANPTQD
jgi:hypothetical protein